MVRILRNRWNVFLAANAKSIYRRMSPADISKARKLARGRVKLDFRGRGATPMSQTLVSSLGRHVHA